MSATFLMDKTHFLYQSTEESYKLLQDKSHKKNVEFQRLL